VRRLIPLAFILVGSAVPVCGEAVAQTAGPPGTLASSPLDTLPTTVVQRFVGGGALIGRTDQTRFSFCYRNR
jgi:hypothetical protein